jgi:hypothetical protein
VETVEPREFTRPELARSPIGTGSNRSLLPDGTIIGPILLVNRLGAIKNAVGG